jgi:thiamine transporter
LSWDSFFTTPLGVGAVVTACCVALLLFGACLYRRKTLSIRTVTYSAAAMALAFVLSNVKLFQMPQGGSVTPCSMLFIALIGYWFGPASGILVGVAHGLLNLAVDPYVVHPLQLLLDYPLAFGALGLAGFFRNAKLGLHIGCAVGILMRGLMSCVSGFVFFAEYAGDANPVIYSVVYNLSYIIPEILLTLIVISIPPFRQAIDSVGRRAG